MCKPNANSHAKTSPTEYRWIPLDPNMDNLNSQIIRSPVETTSIFTMLICLLNSKEFYILGVCFLKAEPTCTFTKVLGFEEKTHKAADKPQPLPWIPPCRPWVSLDAGHCRMSPADAGGPGGPGPTPCPQDFFKIGQFFGKTPILSKFWAQGPPPSVVKTPLGPPDQNPGSAPGCSHRTVWRISLHRMLDHKPINFVWIYHWCKRPLISSEQVLCSHRGVFVQKDSCEQKAVGMWLKTAEWD